MSPPIMLVPEVEIPLDQRTEENMREYAGRLKENLERFSRGEVRGYRWQPDIQDLDRILGNAYVFCDPASKEIPVPEVERYQLFGSMSMPVASRVWWDVVERFFPDEYEAALRERWNMVI